jgi:hypothetical protein
VATATLLDLPVKPESYAAVRKKYPRSPNLQRLSPDVLA